MEKTETKEELKQPAKTDSPKTTPTVTPGFMSQLADEVARVVVSRLPSLPSVRRKKTVKKPTRIENAIFLDTSAIIDGRIFDIIHLSLLNGIVVIPHSILLELKHIADSQDMVRRERGRRGLEYLEQLKKAKVMPVHVLSEKEETQVKTSKEVDEKLILLTKFHKGKLITCDYNLEKKATIQGVKAINVNVVANSLKVIAVPGEALHINVQHPGKDPKQGVGYLDDGTMIVVEDGSEVVGTAVDVVVARVIQTATGRILFAKKI